MLLAVAFDLEAFFTAIGKAPLSGQSAVGEQPLTSRTRRLGC
jgi:hypothetical protein